MKKLWIAFADYGNARFFIPFGVVLMIFSLFFFDASDKTRYYKKTQAVVTSAELFEDEHYAGDTHFDATYDVYVKYTVDGKEYEGHYGVFPDMAAGDVITIGYDPDDPSQIAQPISMVIPAAMITIGAGALIFGIVSGINTYKRRKKLKEEEESWK